MDDVKAWHYEKLVDEVDELIAKAFYNSGLAKFVDDPLRCYLLLVILLRRLGEFSPGMNMNLVRERMKQYIGDEQFEKVEQIAQQIAEKILEIIHPTYTAASYWSPLDRRRHTVSHRRKIGGDENEKQLWAYAYAFYVLTLIGQKRGYYSATQYTAMLAPRKRGVRVCYQEKPEADDPNGWWHIPRGINGDNHKRILNETGLTDSVKKYLLNGDFTMEQLRDELRLMLVNREPRKWEDLNSFAENFINHFPHVMSNISEETHRDVINTKIYANNLFGAQLTDSQLTDEQSLFMLMTNLIYDVAFPTNYFYAFPVRIENLYSVMTIGTELPLTPFEHSALTRIVTSIFIHPLLLDYATQEAEAVADRERAKSYEAIQNAGFVFGHDLKNRLDELRYEEVRAALKANEPGAVEMAEACLGKLASFSATPELLRVMGKFVSGELPHEWAKPELVDDWPNTFDATEHLTKAAKACDTIVRQVVAPYVKGLEFDLRQINDHQMVEVKPLDEIVVIDLPPVSNSPSTAPPFAILAGLAEIVRNAIKAVIDKGTRDLMLQVYGKLHLDYKVEVETELEQVRVTIWNPFLGQAPPVSETISRMVSMYKRLGAVEITPVNPNNQHPLEQSRKYGHSEFIFRPTRLRFARKNLRR